MESRKQIAILGSTGSIGRQTLEVIARYPSLFEVYVLTANDNVALLIEQAKQFMPDSVVIANESLYPHLCEALSHLPIKVYAGSKAIEEVVTAEPISMVVTAMVGYAGLLPTIRAIEAGKAIALANKETLVVAGDLITRLAIDNRAPIIPVDSEHSALFQCLAGEGNSPISKVILTASGGPFRTFTAQQMERVTSTDALRHPKWEMGAKITIDSSTMMNKGFEVIEAKWLFALTPQQIEVVVHPQSIVHSMVEFADGAVKAQLGTPDMKLPIAYALHYPHRLPDISRKLCLADYASLTFEAPDTHRFPHLQFAYQAMQQGGTMPCILNAANEVVVAAFLQDKIAYNTMAETLSYTMAHAEFTTTPSLDHYIATDAQARRIAAKFVSNKLK